MTSFYVSSPTSTLQEQEVYKGILYKKGKVNTSWKKRYFVLVNTRRLLYYKSQESYDNNEKAINFIPLQYVNSISPINYINKNQPSVEKQLKKYKSRRSKKRTWSIDFGSLLSKSKTFSISSDILSSSADDVNDDDSDNEEDEYIEYFELKLNKKFTFEMVTKKRTYVLCSNDAIQFNQWIKEIEAITFGKKVFKGWLTKRGEGMKNWKRRWFVIYNTKEMRYYEDQQRAHPKGSIFIFNIQNMIKVDKAIARKRYRKSHGSILELNLPNRTWVLLCVDDEERQEWFSEIVKLMDFVPYLQPIFDDFLYKYDEEHKIWIESYFAIGNQCIFQFESEDEFDDYQSIAYFTKKEYHDHHQRFIQWQMCLYPFDSKTVQKIRPGSGISRRLEREFIFIINSSQQGKYFFATRKQRQFNRWFKNLRRMGARTSMSAVSSPSVNINLTNTNSPSIKSNQLQTMHIKRSSSRSISHSYKHRHSPSNSYSQSQNNSLQIKNITPLVPKNENMIKMLEMMEILQKDIKLCSKDVKYVRKRWIIENDVKRENKEREQSLNGSPPLDTSDGEEVSYNYEPRNNKKRKSNDREFKDRRKNEREPQANHRSSNSNARLRYRQRRREYSSSGEDFY